MYYVYILISLKDSKTYVGYTKDLNRRFKEHNCGTVKATKYRRPLQILFSEKFLTAKEAKNKELWWKSSSGRKKLKDFFSSA